MNGGRQARYGPVAVLILVAVGLDPARAAEPPVITRPPADVVGKRLGEVTFKVTAKGTPPLQYRWFRNGSSTWPTWNRSSLTLVGLTENDLGTYTVTVTNAAGSVTSEPARLTLSGEPPPAAAPAASRPAAAPAIPPRSGGQAAMLTVERARAGESFRLEATAEGKAPFRYQWLKDARPIPGATQARFEIAAVSAADAGLYVCMVSNAAGATPSLPILLEVRPR